MSLIDCITVEEIKKIFSNNQNKKDYLENFSKKYNINISIPKRNIDKTIIGTWDYEKSKDIIRDLFKKTDKYNNNLIAKDKIEELVKDWEENKIGNFEWPFQAVTFDSYVHKLNRKDISELEKDSILSKDAIRFRRIKDINAWRNDYIEHLIFEKFNCIIPTFKNRKGVDFYINGEPYDQKVSRSVTKQFIEKYKENYKEKAMECPSLVAKNLYAYQDAARFGDEPRLLVVYLDSDLSIEDINSSLNETDFSKPLEVDFDFSYDGNLKHHTTSCYLVLLHKQIKKPTSTF